MKRLLHSLTTASLAAVMIIVGIKSVGASDNSQNAAEKTEIPAQNDSQKEPESIANAKANVNGEGIILSGYDVVAYFKQGKPVRGNHAFQSTYQGTTYLFASSADKADFDKDSARYAPQYGAFCSYGVANGVLANLEERPDAFVIYKGKLYLCGNQEALKAFKNDIDSNIEKADANWRLLVTP